MTLGEEIQVTPTLQMYGDISAGKALQQGHGIYNLGSIRALPLLVALHPQLHEGALLLLLWLEIHLHLPRRWDWPQRVFEQCTHIE